MISFIGLIVAHVSRDAEELSRSDSRFFLFILPLHQKVVSYEVIKQVYLPRTYTLHLKSLVFHTLATSELVTQRFKQENLPATIPTISSQEQPNSIIKRIAASSSLKSIYDAR